MKVINAELKEVKAVFIEDLEEEILLINENLPENEKENIKKSREQLKAEL